MQLVRAARAWAPAPLGLLGSPPRALGLAVLGWVLRAVDGYTRTAGYALVGHTRRPRWTPPRPSPGSPSAWMLPAAVLTLTLAAACARCAAAPSLPDGAPGRCARYGRSAAGALALASVPVAALGYPVPVWTVLLALLAAAVLAATALPRLVPRRETPPGSLLVPLVVAALLAVAQPLSWYDETLTAACLLVTLALLAVAHRVGAARPRRGGGRRRRRGGPRRPGLDRSAR